MGSWQARASTASITGACVFALATGAGAVFVGDWWGSHHGPVVTEFVTTPASPPHGSHPAIAGSAGAVRPAATRHQASGSPARAQAQADAQTARVAGTGPTVRVHHSVPPATLVPVAAASASATPTGIGATPTGTQAPGGNPGTRPSASSSGNAPTAGSTATASTTPPG